VPSMRKQPVPGAEPVTERSRELSENVRRGLPARFEAVGEALASGVGMRAACAEVGRKTARDGADLGAALRGLRSTYALVVGREPDYHAAVSLSVAWGEATLAYVHQLSCEDPLTGLASTAHVRARLAEIYRGAEQTGRTVAHAVVVVDLPLPATGELADRFGDALWMVKLTETVRAVFSGNETIGRVGGSRLAVLVDRSDVLGHRVGLLRELIEGLDPRGQAVRVWIEGLPASNDAAVSLLDELTRG
jgi:GGDEF domain-containing protein